MMMMVGGIVRKMYTHTHRYFISYYTIQMEETERTLGIKEERFFSSCHAVVIVYPGSLLLLLYYFDHTEHQHFFISDYSRLL